MDWFRWAPVLAAGTHIFEEFAYPGGFVAWYARYLPENAARLTRGYVIGINALLLFGCFEAGQLGATPRGTALWLTMASFLFFNAWFHIAGAIQTRGYSPGMVSAICLYLPVSIYGYTRLLSTGRVSRGTALVAILIGTTHEVWVYTNEYLRRGHSSQH